MRSWFAAALALALMALGPVAGVAAQAEETTEPTPSAEATASASDKPAKDDDEGPAPSPGAKESASPKATATPTASDTPKPSAKPSSATRAARPAAAPDCAPTASVEVASATPLGGKLRVTGEGFCHPTDGGSRIAIKIDEGAFSRLDAGVHVQALAGTGGDPLAQYFVRGQRAPRVVAALLVGAALAVSGAIFQSLSDNPLGSPDVIGFTTGSATGALLAIIVIGGGPAETALGALAGGAATAAVVYLLAWRHGLTGGRLVLVGIGIAAVLQGVNNLLLVRASLVSAQTAAQWLAGSFNATTWPKVLLLGAALLVLLPAAGFLARPLGALVLGDDLAAALGVRVERVRTLLVVAGVALVAVATATAGPIGFIALAAPQIARRLTRTAGIGLGAAALTGAALVLASDLLAQRLLAPTQLAVGVVTGVLGGGYLIWLLGSQWRKGAR